jgi:two-component system response regulator DevR
VRNMLIQTINSADGLQVVGAAASAHRALAEIPGLHPTVALLDGHLPDGNGIELCRTLKAVAPEVECIILTAGTTIDWGPAEAAQAGAAAFLIKKLTDFPLIDTIRTVATQHK